MVKIIPQEEKEVVEKESIFVAILFWFSLFIFIVSVTLFFVFNWYTKSIKAKTEELKAQLAQLETPQKKLLKEEITNYKKKIDDFPSLLQSHKIPSKFFDLIEKNVHPDIWFNRFNFDADKNRAEISGETSSLFSLSQQILIFENLPEIEKVEVSNIQKGEGGGVKFDLIIFLNPQFLLLK